MNATIYLAMLTHPTGMSTVGLPEGSPFTAGRPLHLSLHTSAKDADAAVVAALRSEWDAPALGHAGLSYSFGPSSEWAEHDLLAEAERHGYTATVSEHEVEL